MTTPADTPVQDAFPAGPKPGDRTVTFLENPIVDQMLRSMVTLTMELSVTRERMRAMEQVLDAQGLSVASGIEDLVLSPEEDDARRAMREKLIADVLGPIIERLEKA